MGDNQRLATIWWQVPVTAIATVFSLLLVIVGDSSLRALGVMGSIFSLGVLIPVAYGLRNTLRRMRNGRGLVPGDPYRALEGVDPAEARPRHDEEA